MLAIKNRIILGWCTCRMHIPSNGHTNYEVHVICISLSLSIYIVVHGWMRLRPNTSAQSNTHIEPDSLVSVYVNCVASCPSTLGHTHTHTFIYRDKRTKQDNVSSKIGIIHINSKCAAKCFDFSNRTTTYKRRSALAHTHTHTDNLHTGDDKNAPYDHITCSAM